MIGNKHAPETSGDALRMRNRQIAAVHKISSLLFSTLDLDDRLRDILTVSMQTVEAAAGTIFLYRQADDKLVFQYVVGEKANELAGMALDATQGLAGEVFQSGEPKITNDPQEDASHRPDVGENIGFQTDSIITLPLKNQTNRPVGVMQILNKQHGDFTPDDLEVLEIIASVAATAIENARLSRDAQLAAVAHAVGNLSHDIKNKVTPISLAVNTLRPTIEAVLHDLDEITTTSPEVADSIRKVTRWLREDYAEQFDIMLDQVQEIQDYTKLIADALKGSVTEPQLDLHDPAALIDVQLKKLEPIARSRQIELIRQFDPVPICRFDRFLIEGAVFNLVHNAIPETPDGGCIVVRITAVPEGRFPQGRHLLIEVKDTGHGMPKPVMERILRGDAKSTKPGGTGLGTRIVYNAVTAHKGVFEGESQENVGTTFRLKLPLLAE